MARTAKAGPAAAPRITESEWLAEVAKLTAALDKPVDHVTAVDVARATGQPLTLVRSMLQRAYHLGQIAGRYCIERRIRMLCYPRADVLDLIRKRATLAARPRAEA